MKVTIPEAGVACGTWNHRVIRYPDGEDTVLIVHQVHYDAAGNVHGWTQDGARVCGEDLQEVGDVLLDMARSLFLPILVERTVDGHLTLVDESTGEPARGAAVADLPIEQRAELENMAEFVEQAVAPQEPTN